MQTDFLYDHRLQNVLMSLEQHGQAYCVGGCVRDRVLGRECDDVDIATDLTPDQVKNTLGHFTLHPTGLDHGTWTVEAGGKTFEVTTFRKDVATDGRRATVEYADSIEDDAQRRDFTINALYMDRHGQIYDPTGTGKRDAKQGILTFVGTADSRCKEDYLRILRMYRFMAQLDFYAKDSAHHACADNVEGLTQVSYERIWVELKKILGAPNPMRAMGFMEKFGVLDAINFSGDMQTLGKTVAREKSYGVKPSWSRRYVAFSSEIPPRCAKREARRIATTRDHIKYGEFPEVAAYKTGKVGLGFDAHIIWAAQKGLQGDPDALEKAKRGASRELPVGAQDFMDEGVLPGKELGRMMRRANEMFVESFFMASRTTLIRRVLGEKKLDSA